MIDEERRILKEELLAEKMRRRRANPLKYHVLLKKQEQFRDDPAKTKCLWGGNRSGKSQGIADYLCNRALETPNMRIWVVGETFQDSIAIQQRKIDMLMPKEKIKYGRYDQINGYTNRKLLLTNGSLFTFRSYDQGPTAFQSDDIDIIANDEEPPLDIVKEQRMRLIDRDGEMIISMTSLQGVTDLIADMYEDHDIVESKYAPLVDEVLPRIVEKNGIRFYMLWTTENPHINHERVLQEAKLMTKQEIKSRIYGIPMNLSGKIYMTFNKDVHTLDSIEDMPEGSYTLYEVLDPHDRKPYAITWYAVHKTGTAYQVDEYPTKKFIDIPYGDKTYREYAKIIKEKRAYLKDLFGVDIRRGIIDPNFGNKTVLLAKRQGKQSSTTPKKELQKLGLFYQDAIDTLEAGHLKVREQLFYEEKDGEIVVQPKFIILSHCTNTITHMSRYSRKDLEAADGDVKDKVKPKDKYKDFCFDDITEVLTPTGWKKFANLKDDKVGTVNLSDNSLEFQKPTRHINYNYEGVMFHVKAKCVDMLVTLNHKMLIVNQGKTKPEFKMPYDVKPQMRIPIACDGIKSLFRTEPIKIGGEVVCGSDWAAFLGIYLSEGCATGVNGGKIQIPGRGYSVYIAQGKKSSEFEDIEKLMERLPFNFRYDGRSFCCSNKKLWKHLRPLGNSYQKYFPAEVWRMARHEMQIMWEYLVKGDGWHRAKGVDTYCTISKRLFDDVQAMLTLLGYATGVTTRMPSKCFSTPPKEEYKKQYWISAKTKKVASICKSGQEKRAIQYGYEDYKGEVFCVTVPNGTLVVRRNNRVFLSGNCDNVRYFWMSNPVFVDESEQEEDFKRRY